MRWKLAHEDHAIERVSVSFQFKEPLPSKPWQSLISAASQLFPQKGFLVSNQEFVSQVVVSAGPQPGKPGASLHDQMPQISGWTFRAASGADVREEVSVRRNQFVYATVLYDGWANFKVRVADLLWHSLDQALPLIEMDAIKLEYWDRFNSLGAPKDANYRELLRNKSKYIPEFTLDESDLWHSHIGFFASPGSSRRRLVNLNVDVLDLIESQMPELGDAPQVQRSVGIYSMVQDTPEPERVGGASTGLESTLDEMHTILKALLADVITDEAAKRISLDAQAST
jgi:uncharacterized protein (TIGR04255 family)